MPITITDIARMANVSKATVSAVLNDRPGISHHTRERVREIIEKVHYKPNQLARSLTQRHTKSIGLLIKEIDNPYFSKIMKGVFDSCMDRGYTVLLGSSEQSPAKELQSIETLVSQRVDGLIIAPLQGEDVDFDYLSKLIREKVPLVTLGEVTNFKTNVVEVDNVEGAYKAVSYLQSLGHEKIAYFSGPSHSAYSYDRLEGYRRALLEWQFQLKQDYILQVGPYIENGYERGKAFFGSVADLPTAVLCYNDLVAIGLIDALLEMGIDVPGEVSVIGFDNIDICDSVKVPLTTVDVLAYQIGKTAADLLVEQISEPTLPLNKKVVLEPKIVIRQSVARNS